MKQEIDIPSVNAIDSQIEILKLESDLFEFVLWVFTAIYKRPFKINWHHKILCKILMRVHAMKLLHIIINIPPRYTKTEIIVKIFPAWCYAKNPVCEFLHLAYSDDLALSNSSAVKTIIESKEFQEKWPIQFKQDTTAKKKWKTELGGEFSAAASGGAVTGFGAGKFGSKEFAGALIIDDPLKPDDARSDTKRNHVNSRFPDTIKSRLNDRHTPMIVVMQRLHEDDVSGFLLGGGTELEFTHINLPAVNEDGSSEYDMRQIGDALWPAKHTEEELELMRLKSAMNYAGQYQQRPAPREGNLFKSEYFKYYTKLPDDLYFEIQSWDMTFKKKSKNKNGKVDFVVGSCWAKRKSNGDIYLLPAIRRARMGFPETMDAIESLILERPAFKQILIEDKANGPAVGSTLAKNGIKRILMVEPCGDKEERAELQIPLYKAGNIFHPHESICPWIVDFENELKVFPNGKQDDQVDSATQAIEYLDKIGSAGGMGEANRQQDRYSKSFGKNKKTKSALRSGNLNY